MQFALFTLLLAVSFVSSAPAPKGENRNLDSCFKMGAMKANVVMPLQTCSGFQTGGAKITGYAAIYQGKRCCMNANAYNAGGEFTDKQLKASGVIKKGGK